MVKRILLPLILLILISVPASGFTKSESFVNYTANMIYTGCSGKNINIKPTMVNYTTESNTQKELTLLDWPYPEELIKKIIQIFSKAEFKEPKFGPPLIDKRGDGSELIKCGTNKLDIFGITWYWNGIEIIPPLKTDITNVNQTINEKTFIKIGDISFSILGGVSVISMSIISITFISIGSFILFLSKTKKIEFKKFEIIYKKK